MTQGESIEEALSNLREATALYLAVVLYRCTGN
jgi:predicted RNase H-like HicB family nuclease